MQSGIPRISISPLLPAFGDLIAAKLEAMPPAWKSRIELCMQPDDTPRSWSEANASSFKVRGKSYLQDGIKMAATTPLCELMYWDLFSFKQRDQAISSHPKSFVQRYMAQYGAELPQLFVVTILIPGIPEIACTKYFMPRNRDGTSLSEGEKLWKAFVDNDDVYRNSRLKIIPIVKEGPWIVKKAIGSNPFIIAKSLKVSWHRTSQYLEAVIDISSDKIARHLTSLCRRHLSSLVLELGFVVEGKEVAELPEVLLASICLKHVDFSKAVPID